MDPGKEADRARYARAQEEALLGTILRSPGCYDDVADLVKPHDFVAWPHPVVWSLMADLRRRGKPIDLPTLADAALNAGKLDDLARGHGTGYAYLGRLFERGGFNAPALARVVVGLSQRRDLARLGRWLVEEAEGPTMNVAELLRAADERLTAVSDRRPEAGARLVSEAVAEVVKRLDAVMRGEPLARGVPHGLPGLDAVVPVLADSELVVLAARPSVGKTALGMAVALHAAYEAGAHVLFASLEQSREEVAMRALATRAGVELSRLRAHRVDAAEAEALADSALSLGRPVLWLDDRGGQTVHQIAATARRLRRAGGLALVLVDYVQLIAADRRGVPRHEQVAEMTRGLKQLARELCLPVLALAQLGRGAEDRAHPRLSDLRESGSIEADADTVLLVSRAPEGDRDAEEKAGRSIKEVEMEGARILRVDVAKQRNGPTGLRWLYFDRPRQRFRPPDWRPVRDDPF